MVHILHLTHLKLHLTHLKKEEGKEPFTPGQQISFNANFVTPDREILRFAKIGL